MFDLSEKTVLITGAGGHLGSAIVSGFARAGATTILVGRDEARLAALRDTLAAPDRCHVRGADLSDAAELDGLIDWVDGRFDALHGLVNNAYGGKVGPVSAIETADFQQATLLNLTVPFRLTRDLAPLLTRSAGVGTSSVVNIGSMYGKVSPDPAAYGDTGTDNPAHYGATKAALIQLTRYLACNLHPETIRVNSVSPGPFPNPDRNPSDFLETLARKVPMRRVGSAAEVAGPVLFLISDASSFVNGADLAVDGGWTAW